MLILHYIKDSNTFLLGSHVRNEFVAISDNLLVDQVQLSLFGLLLVVVEGDVIEESASLVQVSVN